MLDKNLILNTRDGLILNAADVEDWVFEFKKYLNAYGSEYAFENNIHGVQELTLENGVERLRRLSTNLDFLTGQLKRNVGLLQQMNDQGRLREGWQYR